MIKDLPDFLTQDETYIYCSKENSHVLNEMPNFIPLENYIENTQVRKSYYNVIGYIDFKQVVIKE